MTFNGTLKKDEVATITFNRPEVSNGFNIPMCGGEKRFSKLQNDMQ